MEQSNWIHRKRHLRVLHIMSGFGGGISSFIQNKAEQMLQYNVQFDVLTYDDCSSTFIEAIQATGGDVYKLINPKTQGWRAFYKSYTNVLKTYKYDAIHCHINGYRTLPYWLISKKYHTQSFYVHAHQTYKQPNMTTKAKVRMLINQQVDRLVSDAFLGCGAKAINDVYGFVPKNDMMIIPNSINLKEYNFTKSQIKQFRNEHRKEFNLSDDEFVIGFIGRLMPVKNHSFVFKLVRYMIDNNLPGKVLIVGSGKLEKKLKEEVKQKGLTNRIQFTGRLVPMSEYYPMFDVLILPSLVEGLPTIAVEAQAIGVPLLMSDEITKEVDFNLGLIDYLSLNTDFDVWYQSLVRLAHHSKASKEERFAKIESEKFTNEKSAELYVKFLLGEISHYHL